MKLLPSLLCLMLAGCAADNICPAPTTQTITQAPPAPQKPAYGHITFGSTGPYCLTGDDVDTLHQNLLKTYQYQTELEGLVKFYQDTAVAK